jgi:Lrp/AsnC family leucine-responsive transcriptional regulator
MVRIDETNLQILKLLQQDGRMSMTDLARAVGRSESTTRERVTSLELGGFLQGYQARVDWSLAGLPATAVIRARCDINQLPDVAKRLTGIPYVTRAMLLTGARPVMALLRVRDVHHLQSLLRETIAQGNLKDVEAEIALTSLVEQRPPSLSDGFPTVPDLVSTPAAAAPGLGTATGIPAH